LNVLVDLLSWILTQKQVSPVLNYLDDFLTMGHSGSSTCTHNLATIKETCSTLGIPLALEKVRGPSHCLTFLGITLDTQEMVARLPEDKLLQIRSLLATWLSKKKMTKREILPLVGLLQHVEVFALKNIVTLYKSFLFINNMYTVCSYMLSPHFWK